VGVRVPLSSFFLKGENKMWETLKFIGAWISGIAVMIIIAIFIIKYFCKDSEDNENSDDCKICDHYYDGRDFW
jgi:hypothetical protein